MASPQKELLSNPKSKEEGETKAAAVENVEDEEDQGLTCVGWDYATALESGDMTAHLKLIGVPPSICSSQVVFDFFLLSTVFINSLFYAFFINSFVILTEWVGKTFSISIYELHEY